MKCDRCNTLVDPGEVTQHLGETLCDDCYMDVLSPAKGCDPWAVFNAKSALKGEGDSSTLAPIQVEILRVLEETGGIEPSELLKVFDGKLTQQQLEHHFATLRHMEKARGEKRGAKVFLRLW